MKIIITVVAICLCLLYEIKGQSNDNPKKHPITLSMETEFPIQHLARLTYSIKGSKVPIGASLFIQGGFPGYLNQFIDIIVDKKEKGNQYLKKNMQPMPGMGAGASFFYRHWSIELLYQNTGYKLKEKNARELVENLLPDDASYIAYDMDNFSKIFPMFGDVYNNYKLTSQARLQQISSHVGYKFLFRQNGRLGGEFKLGALTIFESNLRTTTEQTNEAADYLISLVNSYLDEELREDTQWLIVPTASVGLFVRL
jgi:hypothetical protein